MEGRSRTNRSTFDVDLFQAILRNVEDQAVFAIDGEGRISGWGVGAEALLGYVEHEMVGVSWERLFRPLDVREGLPAEQMRRARLESGLKIESWLVRKDGAEIRTTGTLISSPSANGTVPGFIKIVRERSDSLQNDPTLRRSAATEAAILETALEAIVAIDHQGKIVEYNPAAERMFGFGRNEAIGRDMADLIIPAELRSAHRSGLARYLQTGAAAVLNRRIEIRALRRDGTEFPVELAITRVPEEAPPRFIAYVRDIADRKREESRRNMQFAVTRVLSEAGEPKVAAEGVLRAVCENLGWDLGVCWIVDREQNVLVPLEIRRLDFFEGLEFVESCRGLTFSPGAGVPGLVWKSRRPFWSLEPIDEPDSGRAESASRTGLRSHVAIPIGIGAECLGVLEFFDRGRLAADTALFEAMESIAGQFAQYLQRKEAENELRRRERELADFFENAPVGIRWVSSDGTILRANQAELDLLGYARDEYVGRRIVDFYDDREAAAEILRKWASGEDPGKREVSLRHKDGSIRHVLIHANVFRRDGRFAHASCISQDITDRKSEERKRKESDQRFAKFMRHLPGLAWIKDLEGRYVFANDAAEKAFGLPRERLYGKTDEEVFPAETAARYRQNDQRAVLNPSGIRVVETLDHPDGVRHHSIVEKFPIPGPDDSPALIGGIAVDITDVKRAEEALRQNESQFRLLVDSIPQLAWMTRPDGYIFWYNRRWYDYTGTTFEEMEGWGWESVHDPRELPRVLERWKSALAEGVMWEDIFPLRRADGEMRRHLSRAYPVRDDAGRVVRWFGTNTDIEDQLRADDRRRFLLEIGRTVLVTTDPEQALWDVIRAVGEHLKASRCCYSEIDETAGTIKVHQDYCRDVPSIAGAYAIESFGEEAVAALERAETIVNDDTSLDPLSARLYDAVYAPLRLRAFVAVPMIKNGRWAASFMVHQAEPRRWTPEEVELLEMVAERTWFLLENARLYHELREADRRKNEFLATLAHELRNPLAPIRNALHLMSRPEARGLDLEPERAMAERQVVHLARLIDDLMDVARISQGKIVLHRRPVELAPIVREAVESARPQIDERRHRTTLSLPERPIFVLADATRLEQILWNLLNNAAKYTEPGGTIDVSIVDQGSEVAISVRDTGLGISAEMLPRIFDLFVQVDAHADHAQGGLGIGLSLVKTLVDMHGGSIVARSDGPGLGSEFVLRWPVAPSEAKTTEPIRKTPRPSRSQPPRRKILVVDDNLDAAKSLAKLLEKLYRQEVRLAHDGPKAILAAEEFRPDLILLDIGLPGLSGYEVAERLRLRPEFQDVSIAALTGWGQEEDRRRSSESGIDLHYVKPVNPDEILNLLHDPRLGRKP